MIAGGDPDEWYASRAGRACIVDGIADVPDLLSGPHTLDGQQAVGRRFGLRDVFRAQQRIELAIRSETLESDLGLVLQAAGKDREAEPLPQAFEQSGFGKPLFTLDEPVSGFSSIGANEDLIKIVHDGVIGNLDAQIRGDL